MSKINLEAPFTAFRGKICKHSKIIFAQRGQTQYTSQICNPRTKAYSEEEIARQGKFKQAVVNANAALADSTQKATYEAEYKAQSKYKTYKPHPERVLRPSTGRSIERSSSPLKGGRREKKENENAAGRLPYKNNKK